MSNDCMPYFTEISQESYNIELTRAQSAKATTVNPEPGDSYIQSLGVAFNDLLWLHHPNKNLR